MERVRIAGLLRSLQMQTIGTLKNSIIMAALGPIFQIKHLRYLDQVGDTLKIIKQENDDQVGITLNKIEREKGVGNIRP